MNAPLYNTEILRLAATTADHERISEPDASVEKRSATCGSRMTVDVRVDANGRVVAVGLLVQACALGQASASLMAMHARGRSASELAAARDGLARWLAGELDAPPPWPGVDVFARALPHTARHGAICLPFEAVAEAAALASGTHP